MERRDRHRPDDPFRVMILFDRGCGRPADPDAVAAHQDELLLALLIEKCGFHFFTVLAPQHKDMAHFDPANNSQGLGASWAGITGVRVAEIRVALRGEVAVRSHVYPVPVRGVAAHYSVDQMLYREIGHDRPPGQSDVTGEPHRRPCK